MSVPRSALSSPETWSRTGWQVSLRQKFKDTSPKATSRIAELLDGSLVQPWKRHSGPVHVGVGIVQRALPTTGVSSDDGLLLRQQAEAGSPGLSLWAIAFQPLWMGSTYIDVCVCVFWWKGGRGAPAGSDKS